ncbi:SpoIIE family protein phosphatase [Microvirga sp. TS319]|uniref:SpoIIE family protein phosphatase n=1 Tax=Microvirga sp. TS319 TaxID=3241165 RepID=UPI00351A186C
MLLRHRLSIIASAGALLIVCGLLWASRQGETISAQRLSSVATNGQNALWQQLVRSEVERLDQMADALQNPSFLRAIDDGGTGRISSVINAEFGATRDRLAVLELSRGDGRVLHSTGRALDSERALDLTTLAEVAAGASRAGLWQSAPDRFLIAKTFPLRDAKGDTVVVTLGLDAADVLGRFAESLKTDAFLINPRGRMVVGTGPELWHRLLPRLPLRSASVATQEIDGRIYSLVGVPVSDLSGGLAGLLVTLDDATQALAPAERIRTLSMAGSFLFALALVAGLHVYLIRAFRPLDRTTKVLNALARGDTTARIAPTGDDEIGRIAETVSHFRDNAIALDRLRLQQTRQRRRQERLIRGRMKELAGTLDSNGRDEILTILDTQTPHGGEDADFVLLPHVLQQLSNRITQQHLRLNELIADLRDSLVTKTKLAGIQQELEIARQVQLAMVPATFPAIDAIDIDGGMIAAKEVGGDFFDCFALTENTYVLMIGDVSGKGVPASLFMAITRTLLRATALYEPDPARCVESVNNLLARENEQMLFVTLFYGVLDVSTGELVYVNAGHNPPLLVSASGAARYLDGTGDMALAVMEDQGYRAERLTLMPGDLLVTFTDGITEAFNPENEAFGEERLKDLCLREREAPSVQVLMQRAYGALTDFVRDAEQSDDITWLALRRRP